MQKKRQTLAEHNAFITAHYDMSASEQNIFSLVLSQLNQDDLPDQRYKVAIKDLEVLTKSQINYQSVRRAAQKLLTRICSITKENGNILDTAIISDSEYIKDAGYFKIGISPQLRPYLFDLKKNFTRYQLSILGALKSKYSKRIYKMLSQFKHTGIMRISLEELKKRLKLLDSKTGKVVFKDWTTFTNKVLEVSKREINEFSDLRCTYEGKKTGRKFTDIEFKIARVSLNQLQDKYGASLAGAHLHERLMKRFKLSDWQATDIVVHVPDKEIAATLYEIELQIINSRIQNVGGYTAKIFDNKYQLGFFKDSIGDSSANDRMPVSERPASSTRELEEEVALVGELMDRVAKVG